MLQLIHSTLGRRNVTQGLLLFIAAAMCLGLVLLQPLRTAVAFSVIDDAMYYFTIARHVATSGIFTQDGITMTNGFHPLWELLLVPLAWLLKNPESLLRAGFILSSALFLGSLLLYFRVGSRLRIGGIGSFAGFILIFANLRSFTLWFSLMESVLLLFCLLGYMAFCLGSGFRRFTEPAKSFQCGLLIGVIVLARLDSFLLFPCYLLSLARHCAGGKERQFLKPAFAASAGAGLFVLPYAAINYHYFGTLATVSSWRKFFPLSASFLEGPFRRFYSETLVRVVYVFSLPDGTRIFIAGLLVCVVAVVVVTCWRARFRLRTALVPVMEFFLFAPIHFLFVYMLVPTDAIFSIWYHVAEILAAGILFSVLTGEYFEKASKSMRAGAVTLGAAFLLWQFAYFGSFVGKKSMTTVKFEMADRISAYVPRDERVAMYDAGIVGYFADRPVVALNGLVGDFTMAGLCKAERYGELFSQYDIRYLVADIPPAIIDSLPGVPLFATNIRTRMMNMSEEAKPLVLFRISGADVDAFFRQRYK